MRLAGTGHDVLLVLIPVIVLCVVGSVMLGGPDELARFLGSLVGGLLGSMWEWVRLTL